jgi:hypothetical protein
MNSEHLFSGGIFTQKLVVLFSGISGIYDEIIELNSVWNRILVSCDNLNFNIKHELKQELRRVE